ncbi:MAG TPA: hypothetical protein VF695_07710 [Sphingomonas sp.]|jgi:hypothetical protein
MKATRDHSQTMQRVKVGMIGLIAVILLIAVASAIIGSVTRGVDANMTASSVNFTFDNTQVAGGEPLAEMGAAPGTTNEAAPAVP